MGCQYFEPTQGGAKSFTVAMPKYTFGRGCLKEAGVRAAGLGMKKVALFTDGQLVDGEYVAIVRKSIQDQGLSCDVFSDIRIEPDDDTVIRATEFLSQGDFDGAVSVGGGSVIDTAKSALVYSRYPG